MNGTYYTITEVFDFGPHISKVILDYGKSMKGAVPSPEQFTVHVTRTSTEGEDFVWPNFMGDKPDDSMDGTRRVSNVYVSDKTGAPCEDGTCLTLELPCFIMEGIGSIIKFNGNFNVFVKVAYDVTQTSEIATDDGAISPQTFDVDGGNRVIYGEWLKEDRYEDPQIPLSYVYYEPEMDADEKIPLIIWLHGAGEGGQEPPIAAIGNKVVNLISPKVQKIFGGKTYLLAPQAPTMWMDDGSGEYTKDGSSKYTEVLDALIGADKVQIIGAVVLAEQPAVKLLLFLLLEQFGFHSRNQRQGAATGLVLHHVADDRDILAVHPLFRDLVVDGHGLPLEVDGRPFQPQHLTPAQTVIGRDEDAQVERVILRDFQQLLDLVLGVEVGPEAVLLGPVHFQHRVDFQIVLAHGILERLAEDGVVVDNGVGGAAIQQDLLLKLVQYLRCDLAELQTQRFEVLRDAPLNHLVVADEGGGLDGCLVNLNPLVEIIQKQHL